MPVIEVNGVVTREVRYGENSRILTVLAEDAGKISVLAGRARTNRSGLLTATQLFSYSNFSLFKGRENSLLKLNEGQVIQAVADIRLSLSKMAYASYFCDIVNHICAEGAEENQMLKLLLNILYKLALSYETDKGEAMKLETVFLLKTLVNTGFAPNCDGCARCGADSGIRLFLPGEGVFLCGDCRKDNRGYEVNDNLYRAMRHIINAQGSAMFAFSLGEKSSRYLAAICEECMRYQLEKDLGTLDYLKKVRDM